IDVTASPPVEWATYAKLVARGSNGEDESYDIEHIDHAQHLVGLAVDHRGRLDVILGQDLMTKHNIQQSAREQTSIKSWLRQCFTFTAFSTVSSESRVMTAFGVITSLTLAWWRTS